MMCFYCVHTLGDVACSALLPPLTSSPPSISYSHSTYTHTSFPPHTQVRLSHKLSSLSRDPDGWTATFATASGTETIHAKTVVLTAPGGVASALVGQSGLVPQASRLADVVYPPVASVTIAYPNR